MSAALLDLPVPAIGERVSVVVKADRKEALLLAPGIYRGDEVPQLAGGPLPDALRLSNTPAPAIYLDTGEVVYGFEVWWGAPEHVDRALGEVPRRVMSLEALRAASGCHPLNAERSR